MIAKGEAWGSPEAGPPDLVVSGGDADLAAAVQGSSPGVLVAFAPSPDSDVARAVGLGAGDGSAPVRGLALPMDALELADGTVVVNAIVLGAPPDRLTAARRAVEVGLRVDGRAETFDAATTVVIATGQWLRGLDLVPRGHPGDGRAEVQAYRLRRSQRRSMRDRLPTGTHLPHPRIVTRSGVEIAVETSRPLPLETDGRALGRTATLQARLVAGRYRLLI